MFFLENVDELVEMGNTSASEEVEQFLVSVTVLGHVPQVHRLRPRDTLRQLTEEHIVDV